jgi:hypothetical protein
MPDSVGKVIILRDRYEVGGMGGLSFLIYPWGLIVQGVALWHFVKRRPEGYWLWIIIFGGVLGAGVYVVAEMIPDLGLLRGTFQGFSRRSRIQNMEIQILDNPSAGNLEELAELYFEQKNYAKVRELLNRAISTRSDSPHAFYLRAKAALGMGDYSREGREVRLLPGDGIARRRLCAHRRSGKGGDLFCAGRAIFDEARDAVQLRELSETGREER